MMTSGGWVPGGMTRMAVCETAVTWAMAASILAFFWK